jgi:hypothetical protein
MTVLADEVMKGGAISFDSKNPWSCLLVMFLSFRELLFTVGKNC